MSKEEEKKKEGNWAKIPKKVWLECTHVQLCVYAAISMRVGGNDYMWAGLDTIAKDSGYSKSMVDKAIRDLIKLGWVGREKQFGRPSKLFVYTDFVEGSEVRAAMLAAKKQASKEFKQKMEAAKERKKLTNSLNLSENDSLNLSDSVPLNLSENDSLNLSKSIVKEQLNNNIIKEQVCESPTIITTRETELTGNTLGIGSYSNSKIKENIYKYLHSKGIPIVPGTDEPQIEKHKYSPDFVHKIQRLEKLHFVAKHWREWENWIEKSQLKKYEDAENQPGTISWALSNYSTDIEPLYNRIESFIRRREEADRRKVADRERQAHENDAYYKSLADKTDAPREEKNIYQRFAESSKIEHVQNKPVAIQGLDEEKKTRLAELMDKSRSGLTEKENLEYRLLIDERRRAMENILSNKKK